MLWTSARVTVTAPAEEVHPVGGAILQPGDEGAVFLIEPCPAAEQDEEQDEQRGPVMAEQEVKGHISSP
jgi:hypothetical protein